MDELFEKIQSLIVEKLDIDAAKVTMDGYNDKTLTATLTINSLEFKGITFESKTFAYDGYYHYILKLQEQSFWIHLNWQQKQQMIK